MNIAAPKSIIYYDDEDEYRHIRRQIDTTTRTYLTIQYPKLVQYLGTYYIDTPKEGR